MDYEHGESASLFIGKVARRAGIGVETIRFYERQELLAARARKESGYRLYSEGVLGKIQFIRRTKELGFSLGRIKGFCNSGEIIRCLRGCLKRTSEDWEHRSKDRDAQENETGAQRIARSE
jgi:DNA-binding transcriptional MerR regulator